MPLRTDSGNSRPFLQRQSGLRLQWYSSTSELGRHYVVSCYSVVISIGSWGGVPSLECWLFS